MANQFQPLNDAIESGLKSLVGELIDGTIEELDGPIRDISNRLAMAARRGRPELVAMCNDQLRIIVLEKRLRVEQSADGLWKNMLGLGVNLLINGAIGGLTSVRR